MLNFKFNFVIIASGFKSGSLPHLKYYDDLINLPSLHVFGEDDDIIPTGTHYLLIYVIVIFSWEINYRDECCPSRLF